MKIYKISYSSMLVLILISLVLMNSKIYKTIYWEMTLTNSENILVILSLMVIMLMFLSMFLGSKKDKLGSNLMILSVILCCSVSFMYSNKFYFFLFFEISMIPMFVSIMLMSKEKTKIYSAIIMILMNMAMAIPTLLFIMNEYNAMKSMNLIVNSYGNMKSMNFILGLMMIFMMLSKAPMFFFHMWLPKAHVDSFTMGSVVLASLMIKLSIIGLIKFNISMEELMKSFCFMILSISWTTVIIALFMMMRSVDIKKLAATSSIIHMSSALNSILSMKTMGLAGSIMVLFSHGLVSAMMFSLIGMMYESTEGRSSYSNKSTESMEKNISMMWVMILFLNVGIPPTMSFFSEIFLMSTFLMMEKLSIIFLSISMILISNASMMSMVKVIFSKKEMNSITLKNSSNMFMNFMFAFLVMNIMIMKII